MIFFFSKIRKHVIIAMLGGTRMELNELYQEYQKLQGRILELWRSL